MFCLRQHDAGSSVMYRTCRLHAGCYCLQGHQSAVAGTTNGTVSSTDHEQPPSDLTSFPPLSPIQTKSHSQPASDAQQSHDSLKPVTVAAANGSHAADTQLPAQPQRLSPRASLDLSLHPEDGTSCIVRIISDPPDAVYEDTDTVIEDPTLVAVLEHAVWRPDAHPVLHVPLPVSRRASHYGDTDSEADESMLSPARSTAGEHQLSQPLLNGHHSHQHHHGMHHIYSLTDASATHAAWQDSAV